MSSSSSSSVGDEQQQQQQQPKRQSYLQENSLACIWIVTDKFGTFAVTGSRRRVQEYVIEKNLCMSPGVPAQISVVPIVELSENNEE